MTGRKVVGWGVVRMAPWHLEGIFQTEEEALARLFEVEAGHEVHFGEGREGEDSFIWSETIA